eukprot:scaffold6918_cov158-Amphora_coffeaeformis.AAC.3
MDVMSVALGLATPQAHCRDRNDFALWGKFEKFPSRNEFAKRSAGRLEDGDCSVFFPSEATAGRRNQLAARRK